MSLKDEISHYIDEANYAAIIKKGEESQAKVLRYVQMNLFGDYNLPQRWHAVEALGYLAKTFAENNDEVYRNVIRRALWAMNDESGNVPWCAPEMMAAIIKARPEQYGSFIPMLMTNAFDNPMCHRGLLWSIGYLGKAQYDNMEKFFEKLFALIDSEESDICGHAIWAFGSLEYPLLQEKLVDLVNDSRHLRLYEDSRIKDVTVGDLANRFIKRN